MPNPTTFDDLRRFHIVSGAPEQLLAKQRAAEHRRALQALVAERLNATHSLEQFVPLFSKTQPYLMGWFHRELCQLLDQFVEAVELGQSPRLMIFAPPRHGKSEPTSRCLPPYVLGRHPNWELIAATYNQDFANDWGRDVRAIVADPTYRDLFPEFEIQKGQNSIDQFSTTKRGSYYTVGRGSALTGRGCNILLIDDPLKDRADADSEVERKNLIQWYESTARTRLMPGGGIIIVQTRWHEDDLAGHLLEVANANPKADQWLTYEFPAIATRDEPHRKTGEALHPERWPLAPLEALQASLDSREWTALYQQSPVPPSGIHFLREWLEQHWIDHPAPPRNVNWYISTDFAISEKETADYTVLQPFAVDDQQNLYFAPPTRGHFSANEIVEKLCDLMDTYRPVQVAIENVHISKTLGPYLRKRMTERALYSPLWSFTAHKDKLARSTSLRGRMQQGKVNCSPTTRATVEPELLSFPAGKHDDIVDAMSVACLMLDELLAAAPPPEAPPVPPPDWSYDWIRSRCQDPRANTRAHVPKHLNGTPRKARTKKSDHTQNWST